MLTWAIFSIVIITALSIDLGLHSTKEKPKISHALFWSILWTILAFGFNLWIYAQHGKEAGLNFLTSYVVERALSVDNLFVFLLVFKAFSIPPRLRHKVLFWGVLGAIVMRALFITGGIALVSYFNFILYLFGLFLIFTGFKLAFYGNDEIHPEKNPIILWIKKWIPIDTSNKDQFFIKKRNVWHITPLFLALIAVEISDVIFAIDSIPAVLGITTDPMIVYTSNIFAILGLRSLYFVLERSIEYFQYLHYALAAILMFIGFKMLFAGFFHIPAGISLGFILGALAISIAASIMKPKS